MKKNTFKSPIKDETDKNSSLSNNSWQSALALLMLQDEMVTTGVFIEQEAIIAIFTQGIQNIEKLMIFDENQRQYCAQNVLFCKAINKYLQIYVLRVKSLNLDVQEGEKEVMQFGDNYGIIDDIIFAAGFQQNISNKLSNISFQISNKSKVNQKSNGPQDNLNTSKVKENSFKIAQVKCRVMDIQAKRNQNKSIFVRIEKEQNEIVQEGYEGWPLFLRNENMKKWILLGFINKNRESSYEHEGQVINQQLQQEIQLKFSSTIHKSTSNFPFLDSIMKSIRITSLERINHKQIATCSSLGILQFWNLEDKRVFWETQLHFRCDYLVCYKLKLYCCFKDFIQIWDIEKREISKIEHISEGLVGLVVDSQDEDGINNKDGVYMICGYKNGQIVVIEEQTKRTIRQGKPISFMIKGEQSTIIIVADQQVEVVDWTKETSQIKIHRQYSQKILSVCQGNQCIIIGRVGDVEVPSNSQIEIVNYQNEVVLHFQLLGKVQIIKQLNFGKESEMGVFLTICDVGTNIINFDKVESGYKFESNQNSNIFPPNPPNNQMIHNNLQIKSKKENKQQQLQSLHLTLNEDHSFNQNLIKEQRSNSKINEDADNKKLSITRRNTIQDSPAIIKSPNSRGSLLYRATTNNRGDQKVFHSEEDKIKIQCKIIDENNLAQVDESGKLTFWKIEDAIRSNQIKSDNFRDLHKELEEKLHKEILRSDTTLDQFEQLNDYSNASNNLQFQLKLSVKRCQKLEEEVEELKKKLKQNELIIKQTILDPLDKTQEPLKENQQKESKNQERINQKVPQKEEQNEIYQNQITELQSRISQLSYEEQNARSQVEKLNNKIKALSLSEIKLRKEAEQAANQCNCGGARQGRGASGILQLSMERELLLGQVKSLTQMANSLEEENEKLSEQGPMMKEKTRLQELQIQLLNQTCDQQKQQIAEQAKDMEEMQESVNILKDSYMQVQCLQMQKHRLEIEDVIKGKQEIERQQRETSQENKQLVQTLQATASFSTKAIKSSPSQKKINFPFSQLNPIALGADDGQQQLQSSTTDQEEEEDFQKENNQEQYDSLSSIKKEIQNTQVQIQELKKSISFTKSPNYLSSKSIPRISDQKPPQFLQSQFQPNIFSSPNSHSRSIKREHLPSNLLKQGISSTSNRDSNNREKLRNSNSPNEIQISPAPKSYLQSQQILDSSYHENINHFTPNRTSKSAKSNFLNLPEFDMNEMSSQSYSPFHKNSQKSRKSLCSPIEEYQYQKKQELQKKNVIPKLNLSSYEQSYDTVLTTRRFSKLNDVNSGNNLRDYYQKQNSSYQNETSPILMNQGDFPKTTTSSNSFSISSPNLHPNTSKMQRNFNLNSLECFSKQIDNLVKHSLSPNKQDPLPQISARNN